MCTHGCHCGGGCMCRPHDGPCLPRTRRVVVGWSYENARLFCQLREWPFRDTTIVTTEYYSALRALRNIEVWLIGPEWHYRSQDLTDIYDTLNLQGLTYRYGETDWLLGVNRER